MEISPRGRELVPTLAPVKLAVVEVVRVSDWAPLEVPNKVLGKEIAPLPASRVVVPVCVKVTPIPEVGVKALLFK